MATVYSRNCSICGRTALRRDSVFIAPATSKKQFLVCNKCGRALKQFMKKNGLLKVMHPKVTGSQKARKLKTKRAR